MDDSEIAVVSEPAKAIETAIVMTRESFMNSGRSYLACTNLERRSGFLDSTDGSVDGRMVAEFWSEEVG